MADEEALAELREAEKQKQRKLQSQQLAAQSIGRQLLESEWAKVALDYVAQSAHVSDELTLRMICSSRSGC